MRRRQQAHAGRASTPPAPSVEELLNIVITRQEAFDAGHLGALFDKLTATVERRWTTRRTRNCSRPIRLRFPPGPLRPSPCSSKRT